MKVKHIKHNLTLDVFIKPGTITSYKNSLSGDKVLETSDLDVELSEQDEKDLNEGLPVTAFPYLNPSS